MWIPSKYGWFSIVRKDGGYHVRARREDDLQQLQEAVGGAFATFTIHRTPSADYSSRIFVPEADGAETLASVMTALGASVDYANFKSMIAVSPDQRDKLHSYHEVWTTMDEYQRRRGSHQSPSNVIDAPQ